MAKAINDIKNISELLSAYGVIIPLIQRDYVQGRVHDTEKLEKKGDEASKKLLKKYLRERERRDNFVTQLISALEQPNTMPMQLTFIYGTKENTGAHSMRHDESIVPIDGQQRLTTLFLLSWMLTHKQTDEDYKKHANIAEFEKGMRSFSYKTRPSSGAFCSSIMNEQIQQTSGSISEILKAQSWFGDDWNMDPSVSAMLQMLDIMEEMLAGKDVKQMLSNLLDGKGIEFELLDMEDYKLTDGLYVKMNARGKQLTEFENWKSEFIGFLEDNYPRTTYNGTIDDTILKKVFGNSQPTLKDYFAHSIEHQWTDLFWKYCKDEILHHSTELETIQNPSKRDLDCYPVIDKYFMNVFEKLTQILFYVNDHTKKAAADYKPSKEIRDEIYKKEENVEDLFAFFDLLCSFNDTMFENIFYITTDDQSTLQNGKVRLFDGKGINLLTRCALNEDSTDISNVLLFALLRYAKEFGTRVDNDMKYYIRSVRNCIESKQYLLSKDVRMVNDFNIYDIVSKDVLDKIEQLINEKRSNTSPWVITDEEAAIQDFSFVCGNLRTQVSAGTPAQVYEVLKVWDSLPQIQKVQLLISYGFTGHYIMTCGHGGLHLFGTDGRWKPLFVHDVENGNGDFDNALNNIVNDYNKLIGAKGSNVLKSLLEQKKDSVSDYSFMYYSLNYDSFLTAHAHNKEPYYYFSINGDMDNLDIAAMQYSGKPTMGYHTDPIVYTVKNELQNLCINNPTQTLYLGYSITGANRACLYVYDTKWWDDKEPLAIFRHKAGSHGSGGWEQLDANTNDVIVSRNDNLNEDRVKVGVDWVKSIYPNAKFEEKG